MKLLTTLTFFSILLILVISRKSNSKDDFTKFKTWGINNNIQVGPVDLNLLSDNNRYFIATENIEEGAVVSSIPLSSMISSENPDTKQIAQILSLITENGQLNKKYNEKQKQISLALYLYNESFNKNSKWKLYFDFFPKSYNDFPIYYSEDLLKLMKGTIALNDLINRKNVFKKEFKILKQFLNKKNEILPFEYNLEEYSRFRNIVGSRCFTVAGSNIALVPFADIYNHDSNKNNIVWRYEEKQKAFVIKANRKILKGEEIIISYGQKPNLNLFLIYGFTIPKNQNVSFNLLKFDFVLENGKKVDLDLNDNVDKNVERIGKISGKNDFGLNLSLFGKILKERVNGYFRSLKEDEDDLENTKDFKKTNVLRIIIEEKKAFGDYLSEVEEMLNKTKNEKKSLGKRKRLFRK